MIARFVLIVSALGGCQGLAEECVPPATTYRLEPRLESNTCLFDALNLAFDNRFPSQVTGEPSCATRTTTGMASMPPPGCVISYEWIETFDDLGGIGSLRVTATCSASSGVPSCETEVLLLYHPDPPV